MYNYLLVTNIIAKLLKVKNLYLVIILVGDIK